MSILSLMGWVIAGLIIGAIARLIMPGRHSMGCLMTIVLGIAGSVVGGLIKLALAGADNPYQPAGWLMSILGAALLLWIYSSNATGRPWR